MADRTVKQILGNRDSDEESSILMDVDGQDRYNWKPRHVISQWENGDGVKHITVLLALTGGSAEEDSEDIEIDVIDNGMALWIRENCSDYQVDMDLFYRHFEKDEEEETDNFTYRQFAMKKAVRDIQNQLRMDDGVASEFCMDLPIRVYPSSIKIVFQGTNQGCHFCHIDLAEKKRVKAHVVKMMDKVVNGNDIVPSAKKAKYSIGKLSRCKQL